MLSGAPPLLLALALSALGCGADGSHRPGVDSDDTADVGEAADSLNADLGTPDRDASGPDTAAPDTRPDTRDGSASNDVDPDPDTSRDTEDGSAVDDLGLDLETTLDDVEVDGDAARSCVDGDPCQLQGYVPPCYEGRCQADGRCQMTRIDRCCGSDSDCAGALTACTVERCVQRECHALDLPGCCTSDAACDDGLSSTGDTCALSVARCAHCPLPCPGLTPIWSARFDRPGDTPAAVGLSIVDLQPGDLVTWQRTTTRAAAGAGALYLGNPRCETYYGGALDAACAPTQTGEQDSQRVAVSLVTPLVALPASDPAYLVAWVRAAVEPDRGRGSAEPDVLRVAVEPLGFGTTWELASTLSLGKSTDWAPLVVDLAPFAGQAVRIRFEFDTLDGEANRFPGVWLDELTVQAACADGGCCESDNDCQPTSDPCERAACLETSRGGPRLCVPAPRTPGSRCAACMSDLDCDDQDPCTADRCDDAQGGRCEHTTFCCLERDLLNASFEPSFVGVSPVDDTPGDGVRWQAREGAAWFGDLATGTYAAVPPGRVSGSLESPLLELPRTAAEGDRVSLDLDLRLSTEWDLAPPDLSGDPISNPAGLDRVTLELVDGPFVTTLWNSDMIGGTTFGRPLGLSFDLERWLGRAVRVRLRFDTGDALANGFPGLFVDRLVLGLRCGSL